MKYNWKLDPVDQDMLTTEKLRLERPTHESFTWRGFLWYGEKLLPDRVEVMHIPKMRRAAVAYRGEVVWFVANSPDDGLTQFFSGDL